jgi:hypothetical protein
VSRYGKNLPTQGRGKPIKASDLNAVRSVAEGLSRQQVGGVLAQTTIAGVPMSLAGEGTVISKAIIATAVTGWDSGEEKMGTGTVTLQTRQPDGSLVAGPTVPVWSFVALSVGLQCYVAAIDGGWEIVSAIC